MPTADFSAGFTDAAHSLKLIDGDGDP